jgi:hypothetical protein
MLSKNVVALVDYDNVAMELVGRGDTVLALADVIKIVVDAIRREIPDVATLNLRLYGGWVDELGYFSRPAERILGELRYYRGRREGIRIATSLALSLCAAPTVRLIGTVRSGTKQRQKMVDVMISLDAVHSAIDRGLVAIISDDDDLVPSAFLAARSGAMVSWFRHRNRASCNDTTLIAESVSFYSLTQVAHERS